MCDFHSPSELFDKHGIIVTLFKEKLRLYQARDINGRFVGYAIRKNGGFAIGNPLNRIPRRGNPRRGEPKEVIERTFKDPLTNLIQPGEVSLPLNALLDKLEGETGEEIPAS